MHQRDAGPDRDHIDTRAWRDRAQIMSELPTERFPPRLRAREPPVLYLSVATHSGVGEPRAEPAKAVNAGTE